MIISDLNPIQFWPIAKQTFNEKIEAGIESIIYIAQFYKKDKVWIQVRNVAQPYLVAYEVGTVAPLALYAMTETSGGSGIWNKQFTGDAFNAIDLTGKCIVFKVSTLSEILTNPSFLVNLNPWSNTGNVLYEPWVWDATAAAKVDFAPSANSRLLTQTFAAKPAGFYLYTFYGYNTLPAISTQLSIKFYLGAVLVHTVNVNEVATVATLHTATIAVPGEFDGITIEGYDAFAAGHVFFMNSFSLQAYVPAFRSDTVQFITTVFGTQLLQYASAEDFGGISFQDSEKFCLRTPAKFYEERDVETIESEGLSDGSVEVLSNSLKRQKLLELEPLPPYLIHKIKMILKNNSLKVDEDYFKAEEPMEQGKLNDKFALFSGKVWLTFRDDNYLTNVYGAPVSLDQTSGLPTPLTYIP